MFAGGRLGLVCRCADRFLGGDLWLAFGRLRRDALTVRVAGLRILANSCLAAGRPCRQGLLRLLRGTVGGSGADCSRCCRRLEVEGNLRGKNGWWGGCKTGMLDLRPHNLRDLCNLRAGRLAFRFARRVGARKRETFALRRFRGGFARGLRVYLSFGWRGGWSAHVAHLCRHSFQLGFGVAGRARERRRWVGACGRMVGMGVVREPRFHGWVTFARDWGRAGR